ncbi:DUF421 domain-containing protein [Ureibacillus acetophenoni]|uniref:Uncharacterized membrane protein YcaP n=1 Tax=Ureibacillus acetophenoni TaxID=614649 RepID=A0A285UFY8_9BACL|nr:DUF421 domain-containing protein [Ureibacillus acetophenoni]SOC40722.1 uncharacterized membrane protein YcaP [Ureibacillus acetophenoni]
MDFFHGQESLTAIQWGLRAVVGFFFLFIIVKVMGLRSISQLRLLDYAMAILIGNIIAHPLSDEGLGLMGSFITMTVLVILYTIGTFLTLKSLPFRHFIAHSPIPLVKEGQIIVKNLRKARISVDDLLSELRKEKIDDIKKVALANWEPDGTITSFLFPEHQPVTKKDLQITSEPFSFTTVVVKEGKIDYKELNKTSIDENWLKVELSATYHAEIEDVLIASIDQNKKLKVFLSK